MGGEECEGGVAFTYIGCECDEDVIGRERFTVSHFGKRGVC